jgi:hypothetical protein
MFAARSSVEATSLTIDETSTMDTTTQELLKLKQQEQEFLELAHTCNRDELVKCARILAMYIALYRQEFGEIPLRGYAKLLDTTALDGELLQITSEGLYEAAEMLKTVMLQFRNEADVGDQFIN